MADTLYVSRLLPDPVMARIQERFQVIGIPTPDPPSRTALLHGVRHAHAILCTLTEQIDEEVLNQASQLRVIANYAVGYNNIAVTQAKARGIVVTNTPEVLTEATADLTWALMLAVARRVIEGDSLVRSGTWPGWTPTQLLGTEVSGKTLGIIGMGRIGRAVAHRAEGFRMPVYYTTRTPLPPGVAKDSWTALPIQEVLRRSDFITLHVPLTKTTVHLIGRDQLTLIRPSTILINTSRGPVIDEPSLVDALHSRRLAGVGLDVYEEEPGLSPGLRGHPNAVTLPHVGSATLPTRTNMGMVCVHNILEVLEGRIAPNAL